MKHEWHEKFGPTWMSNSQCALPNLTKTPATVDQNRRSNCRKDALWGCYEIRVADEVSQIADFLVVNLSFFRERIGRNFTVFTGQ